jgi:hypothetical protein
MKNKLLHKQKQQLAWLSLPARTAKNKKFFIHDRYVAQKKNIFFS